MQVLTELTELLEQLPSIGEKTAARLAFFLVKAEQPYLTKLGDAIAQCKIRTKSCSCCGAYSTETLCALCTKKDLRENTICVVANSQDCDSIEKTSVFKGTYHVLQGLIDPMNGVGPEKIRLKELIKRVGDENPAELVLALDGSVEAEATVLYIKRSIPQTQNATIVSRIGFGLSADSNIANTDTQSLGKALASRSTI
jgi:recombination protein RecR